MPSLRRLGLVQHSGSAEQSSHAPACFWCRWHRLVLEQGQRLPPTRGKQWLSRTGAASARCGHPSLGRIRCCQRPPGRRWKATCLGPLAGDPATTWLSRPGAARAVVHGTKRLNFPECTRAEKHSPDPKHLARGSSSRSAEKTLMNKRRLAEAVFNSGQLRGICGRIYRAYRGRRLWRGRAALRGRIRSTSSSCDQCRAIGKSLPFQRRLHHHRIEGVLYRPTGSGNRMFHGSTPTNICG